MLIGAFGVAVFVFMVKVTHKGNMKVIAVVIRQKSSDMIASTMKKYFLLTFLSYVDISGFWEEELDEAKLPFERGFSLRPPLRSILVFILVLDDTFEFW